MMDLVVPDLLSPVSTESLRRKLSVFGLAGVRWTTDFWKVLKNYPKVRIHEDDAGISYSWCQDNFGDNWIWSDPTQTNYVEIYLIHSEDALLLKLRFTPLDA